MLSTPCNDLYALVDCNNFFASCERAFNPQLEGKPIVVLSNNDGCIVARSNEAKQLGIPMGAPYFQWKTICEKNNVHVFSSNYELYGDMSHRVMHSLSMLCSDIEIYSIDEAFLLLDGLTKKDLLQHAMDIRSKVKQWTGIPISIGIAPTKTLAKLANHIAKKRTTSGVYHFENNQVSEIVLSQFPIADIWGVGRKLTQRLQQMGIFTALDLRNCDSKIMRSHFSIMLEKTIQELRGVSCLQMEEAQPKQQIISSRSFGRPVTTLNELEEAISNYAAKACVRLREQESVAASIHIFLHEGKSITTQLISPTSDSRIIIQQAKACMKKIYQPGRRYRKTGIILMDISPAAIMQQDMFTIRDKKSDHLMTTVDTINQQFGKNSISFCAEGTKRSWQMKCGKRSPRYTTRWEELTVIL